MPREELRESIAHLQEELVDGEPLSPEDRSRLESVLGEVSEILDSENTEGSHLRESFESIPAMIETFEATHPKLAVLLGRIADSLSQLGI